MTNTSQFERLIRARISTRAFLDTPVSTSDISELLDTARWAASGGNLQPWKVYVVAGDARQRVIDAVRAKIEANPFEDENAFGAYPPKLWEPYRSRRFELGEAMYETLGIPREAKAERLGWMLKNFEFFDAPVGLFFTLDERMNANQWAHLGMFMMALMLAAEDKGLATCAQEAWMTRCKTVGETLGIAGNERVYCGMALGYADKDAAVNSLRSSRVPIEDFAVFDGF
ncbi:nitroreductase [Maricaulis sp.]|uniref:nitroreductase n=1 Tax=Maricaulis sp. TaxID=1486257 RepID=UPI002626F701|nr:nitroreductase [Maricaulis sp.]